MMTPPAFGGHELDRADRLRADPEKLAALLAERGGLMLLLDELAPLLDDRGALSFSEIADADDLGESIFLGLLGERPCFACVPASGLATPARADRALWLAIARLPPADLALYGGARSLADWHARHRFCARCGALTQITRSGWQRACSACGAQHFPRVDPVAIMLVEHRGKGEPELLLGRQAGFPAQVYSALAGFVEPGESIEEAVVREVLEEAGVAVRNVTYLASQPWPFPSQLMIGCHAITDDRALTIDTTELEDARWFTRAEVAEAMRDGAAGTSFVPPMDRAIAHSMLVWWLARENRER